MNPPDPKLGDPALSKVRPYTADETISRMKPDPKAESSVSLALESALARFDDGDFSQLLTDAIEIVSHVRDQEGALRALREQLAEANAAREAQAKNYIRLCEAITGGGTFVCEIDPFEMVTDLRDRLKTAVGALEWIGGALPRLRTPINATLAKEAQVILSKALAQLRADRSQSDAKSPSGDRSPCDAQERTAEAVPLVDLPEPPPVDDIEECENLGCGFNHEGHCERTGKAICYGYMKPAQPSGREAE